MFLALEKNIFILLVLFYSIPVLRFKDPMRMRTFFLTNKNFLRLMGKGVNSSFYSIQVYLFGSNVTQIKFFVVCVTFFFLFHYNSSKYTSNS